MSLIYCSLHKVHYKHFYKLLKCKQIKSNINLQNWEFIHLVPFSFKLLKTCLKIEPTVFQWVLSLLD